MHAGAESGRSYPPVLGDLGRRYRRPLLPCKQMSAREI
jgi:hypothetical protein